MTEEQVRAIKTLADQIASSRKGEKYLRSLFRRSRFSDYVRGIAEISELLRRDGENPVLMETVVRAFEMINDDGYPGKYAGVVRELILIRLIEVLSPDRLRDIPEWEITEEVEEGE